MEDGARLVAPRVEVEVVDHHRHQPLGVGGVVDGEAGLEAELVDLLAQDAHARGVERRDPHQPRPRPDEHLDPLLHLGGGLVGEGDREDRPRVGLALRDDPGDPPGQHPRLARAGSGDDEQRRPLVDDGGPLRLVQPGQEVVGRGTCGPLRLLGARLWIGVGQALPDDRKGVAHLRSSLRPATPTTRALPRASAGRSACNTPSTDLLTRCNGVEVPWTACYKPRSASSAAPHGPQARVERRVSTGHRPTETSVSRDGPASPHDSPHRGHHDRPARAHHSPAGPRGRSRTRSHRPRDASGRVGDRPTRRLHHARALAEPAADRGHPAHPRPGGEPADRTTPRHES